MRQTCRCRGTYNGVRKRECRFDVGLGSQLGQLRFAHHWDDCMVSANLSPPNCNKMRWSTLAALNFRECLSTPSVSMWPLLSPLSFPAKTHKSQQLSTNYACFQRPVLPSLWCLLLLPCFRLNGSTPSNACILTQLE